MQKIVIPKNGKYRVLCLGAHADDIEIGCGGTMLNLLDQLGKKAEAHWIVFSGSAVRRKEATASANAFLRSGGRKTISVKQFQDGYFPTQFREIKDAFEALKKEFEPDIIFTHYREDRHQDHRVISDLTWNTFRNHLILEYEIPKYDGDFGSPNLFVELPRRTKEKKVRTLLTHFASQRNKHWFTDELLSGAMRVRGMESGSASGYAEGFYSRKLLLGFSPGLR
jgi:LmbE family N-acetylglucosaminyl deacetylase